MKGGKIALIISIIALVFATLDLLYLSSKGLPMKSASVLFFGVIVVSYFNYTSYKSQKKK